MKKLLRSNFVRHSFMIMGFVLFALTIIVLQAMGLTGIPLFFVAGMCVVIGVIGIVANVLWSADRDALRQSGTQVPAVLTNFEHTGYYNEVDSSRQLKLEVSFQTLHGQNKTSELFVSIDPAIESRLERGMILPIMYRDDIPHRVELPEPLNYNMIEWSRIQTEYFYNNRR